MTDADPVVLVVEDEPDVAETYELWLAPDYEVRTAADGQAALDALGDDTDVDVVLLDRMMPGLSGADTLAEIRARGLDCRVAMVTAVEPDFDVVEMGFDDYLTKPPTDEDIRGVVTDLLERDGYAEDVREYRALVSKQAALEAAKTDQELAESDAYDDLLADIQAKRETLRDEDDRLSDDAAFVSALRDLTAPEEGERE